MHDFLHSRWFDWRRSAMVTTGVLLAIIGIIISAYEKVDATSFANVFLVLLYGLLAGAMVAGIMVGILWQARDFRQACRSTMQVFFTYAVLWSLFAFGLGEASISSVWWRALLGIITAPFVGFGLVGVAPLFMVGFVFAWLVLGIRWRLAAKSASKLSN